MYLANDELVTLQVRAVHDFKELCENSPDRLREFVGRAVMAISVDAKGRYHLLHPFDEDETLNILCQALEAYLEASSRPGRRLRFLIDDEPK